MAELRSYSDAELDALAAELQKRREEVIKGGPSLQEYGKDAITQLGVGTTEAVVGAAGIPGDLEALGRWGVTSVMGDSEKIPQQSMPTTSQVMSGTERWLGTELPEAKTPVGKLSRSIGHQIPGVLMPGGPVQKAINVLAPAVGAEVGEAIGGIPGRVAGTLAGGVLGARGFPATARPEYAAHVGTLKQAGIPMSAGERTGNRVLKSLEDVASNFPWASGRREVMKEAQGRAFTGEVLGKMGAPSGTLATGDAVETAKKSLSNKYEIISQNNTLIADQPMVNDMIATAQKYVAKVIPSQRAAGRRDIQTIIQDVTDQMIANNGQMTGVMYQETRSRLGSMAQGAREKNDSALASAIDGIKKALDGAMMRSIPQDQQVAWMELNKQWRNWKAIEESIKRGGEKVTEGYIDPPSFARAVRKQERPAADAVRKLAEAGSVVLTPLRSSGTGERIFAGSMMGAGLGTGGLSILNDPSAEGIAKGVGATMLPWVLGRGLLSKPVQSFVGGRSTPTEMRNRLLMQQLLQSTEQRR